VTIFPMYLAGCSAGPARVVAMVDTDDSEVGAELDRVHR
jgi:hypothetical protein